MHLFFDSGFSFDAAKGRPLFVVSSAAKDSELRACPGGQKRSWVVYCQSFLCNVLGYTHRKMVIF